MTTSYTISSSQKKEGGEGRELRLYVCARDFGSYRRREAKGVKNN